MLRRNLLTSIGLVNGATRTVTDIVVDPEGEEMPICVMVGFDQYTGPTLNGSVPIAPVEATWFSKGFDCRRIQIPLTPAFAITIHKSQGMTLSKAVIDIGSKETSLGLAYVALSRTKTLESLAVASTYDFSRLSKISAMRLLNLRKAEEDRLLSISI